MSAKTCKELQRRWLREAAREPRIPLPFHMSDCVVGSKQFEYLRDDEPTRLQMQERTIRTLRGLDVQCYGIAVVREDYALVAKDIQPDERFRNPWFMAFEGGVSTMMLESAQSGKRHSISMVFDRQDEFRDRAFELYKDVLDAPVSYRDRLGGLSFEDKDKIAALQAVDIAVYETTRFLVECALGNGSERWQNQLLREMIHINGKLLDANGLGLLKDGIREARKRKVKDFSDPRGGV